MAREHEGLLQQGGRAADPLNVETPETALRQLVTPVEQRFVRTHFGVPAVVEEAVELGGALAHPLRTTLAQLRELPVVTQTVTTECAGNHRASIEPHVEGLQWTGGAIATNQWTGVPLERLLAWAGLKETAQEIAFHSADGGYARSLPLSKALDRGTLIAYELNGQPIPPRYGGPIRLIVPDWYGMASVKWLARIEALEHAFRGEFQTQLYMYRRGEPVTTMRVKSRFLDPAQGARIQRGRVRVRGLAWGGEGGVVEVEVSTGGEYRHARLLGPNLPHAWRRFEYDWDARTPGGYILRCRARDAAGNRQPETPEWNELGYGANAVDRLAVRIE